MFVVQYTNAHGQHVVEKIAFHENASKQIGEFAAQIAQADVEQVWIVPGTWTL